MFMLEQGTFVISIDFELHWGCIESKKELTTDHQQYFLNTRKAIPEMLSIFKKHNIHATWAIVGMLFNKNIDEWEKNKPLNLPKYLDSKVSVYDWIEKNNFHSEDDPFHFAPALIELIKNTKHQEIGTHTYSHYYCLEQGQSQEQFFEDITIAKKIALQNNIEIKSLVFPRNQFNKEYLPLCNKLGITSIRSNPDVWYWSPVAKSTFFRKLSRTLDAYLKINPQKKVYLKEINAQASPIQLPASRLYKPWIPRFSIINKLKLNRILNEMTSAAKFGSCYHLWWHPHNFGNHPLECLEELNKIVNHYIILNKQYGFQSLTMNEIANRLMINSTENKDFS